MSTAPRLGASDTVSTSSPARVRQRCGNVRIGAFPVELTTTHPFVKTRRKASSFITNSHLDGAPVTAIRTIRCQSAAATRTRPSGFK